MAGRARVRAPVRSGQIVGGAWGPRPPLRDDQEAVDDAIRTLQHARERLSGQRLLRGLSVPRHRRRAVLVSTSPEACVGAGALQSWIDCTSTQASGRRSEWNGDARARRRGRAEGPFSTGREDPSRRFETHRHTRDALRSISSRARRRADRLRPWPPPWRLRRESAHAALTLDVSRTRRRRRKGANRYARPS